MSDASFRLRGNLYAKARALTTDDDDDVFAEVPFSPIFGRVMPKRKEKEDCGGTTE